jgi:hypothetical protein
MKEASVHLCTYIPCTCYITRLQKQSGGVGVLLEFNLSYQESGDVHIRVRGAISGPIQAPPISSNRLMGGMAVATLLVIKRPISPFNRLIVVAAVSLFVDNPFSFPLGRRRAGAPSLAFLPPFAFCLTNIKTNTPSRELLIKRIDNSSQIKRIKTHFRQVSGRVQSREFFCGINPEWAPVAFSLYSQFTAMVSFRKDIKDTIAENECTLYLHGKVLH